MAGSDVYFLDAGRISRRYRKHIISQLSELSPLPSESYSDSTKPFCLFNASEHVRGIATGADANNDITLPGQAFDLSGEYGFKTIVVSNGSERGGINGESNSRQRVTV